jgi:hypothetical protein
MTDPHKEKKLGVCDKLFIECNPQKNQVLNAWVILILTQNM